MSAQTNFIYGETLIGTVDGVNTVFTSLYPIDRIEDLRLGSIDYSSFSFTGTTVTLTDAPTVGTGAPIVDYFRSDVMVTPSASTVTFLDLIDSIFLRIGQDSTSHQFPIDLVKEYCVEGVNIHNNLKINPLTKIGTYAFNKAEDMEASVYSATEIDVGTIPDYVPTSGKLLLEGGGLVSYSSVTASAFTSLSGVSFVYPAGMEVNVGYAIPGGVKKISEVIIDGNVLTFADFREFSTYSPRDKFTVIDGYLFLPRTLTDYIVVVNYTKDNVEPVEDADIIDFEPEYVNVLKLYVMKEIYADREEDRAVSTERRYNTALRRYRSYISRQVDGINNVMSASAFGGF